MSHHTLDSVIGREEGNSSSSDSPSASYIRVSILANRSAPRSTWRRAMRSGALTGASTNRVVAHKHLARHTGQSRRRVERTSVTQSAHRRWLHCSSAIRRRCSDSAGLLTVPNRLVPTWHRQIGQGVPCCSASGYVAYAAAAAAAWAASWRLRAPCAQSELVGLGARAQTRAPALAPALAQARFQWERWQRWRWQHCQNCSQWEEGE
jgi:hypothetical protein